MELVKPIKHRYCGGKGYVTLASGATGHCFGCGGTGLVEGDRATIKAAKELDAHRAVIVKALQDLAAKSKESYKTSMAIDGLEMLRRSEPERHAKAEASILAGHPRVIAALADYYQANREAY